MQVGGGGTSWSEVTPDLGAPWLAPLGPSRSNRRGGGGGLAGTLGTVRTWTAAEDASYVGLVAKESSMNELLVLVIGDAEELAPAGDWADEAGLRGDVGKVNFGPASTRNTLIVGFCFEVCRALNGASKCGWGGGPIPTSCLHSHTESPINRAIKEGPIQR